LIRNQLIGLQRISLTRGRGTSVSRYEGCFPRAQTVHNKRETVLTQLVLQQSVTLNRRIAQRPDEEGRGYAARAGIGRNETGHG